MSYTIDERNLERQQMLARCLNPLTRAVLERVPKGADVSTSGADKETRPGS